MPNSIASPQTLQAAQTHLSLLDPVLAPVIAAAGLPTLIPHTNYYQALVDSIISQQLSVKAARSIEQRFCALFGRSDFPPADEILQKSVDELRTAGLSGAKARYVRDLAEHVVSGALKFDHFSTLSNDEIASELLPVKGIGLWTVQMFLIFCMGRLDVLATGDLGIRNGIMKLYDYDHPPSHKEISELAAKRNWHPYESAACWYIWRSLENMPAV
jgi:DNA-3-methyladenine glycosylase II